MKKIPHILINIAVIVLVVGVVYKLFGYGAHRPTPLGVTPLAILRFCNTLLFFSIALNVQRFVTGREPAAEKPTEAKASK